MVEIDGWALSRRIPPSCFQSAIPRRCLDHQPAQCYTLLITPPTSWVDIFPNDPSLDFHEGMQRLFVPLFLSFLCRGGRRLAQWSKRVFAAGLGERNLCGVTCNCNKKAWHVYFINTCFKARFVISDHVLFCSDERWRFAGKGLKKCLKCFNTPLRLFPVEEEDDHFRHGDLAGDLAGLLRLFGFVFGTA